MLGSGSLSRDQAVSARFPATSAAPAASQPPGDMAPPLSSSSPAVSALFRPLQPLQQPSQIQHVPSSQVAGSFSSPGAKGAISGDQVPVASHEATSTRRASLVGGISGYDEPEQEQDDDMPDMGGCDDFSASTRATNAQEVRETTTQAPNRRAAASESHVVRKRNVGVPKFLRFLFQMLELEDRSIISWSHKGTAFQIRQPEELADKILPKYFKHNKVSSFQRQLNYFGFKKWTKTQTNICTFSHPYFLRAEKDRMKLIKRKERGVTTTASPPEANQVVSAQDPNQTPNLMLTQQALKRQKSNTLSTGAAANFLNSAAAGRRHSTGMLPGAEAIGMAAAAAAASASASGGRKRAGGTPAELEFELELEARADAMTHAATPQQQLHHLHRLAEAKELARRPPAKGKRKSLPQVLPPGFGDSLGTGMGMTMGMSMSGNAAVGGGRGIGRRKSDQMLEFASASNSKGTAMMGQFGHFLASSTASSMPQTANVKSDASAVLPITSDTLMQDAYQQQRQQMTRHSNLFGGGVGYGAMETKPELQPPASGGWPASSHMPPQSSSSSASYHPQSGQMMPMLPFKFGDPNAAMASFDGVSIMDYSHASEHQKLQQRHAASYQQQPPQQQQQPKDYIDVLLESAALDENLAAQSPATPWGEPNYPHNTQQNPVATGAATYALLTPQQQQQRQQQLQLSSMGGLPHHPNQRF